MRHLMNDNARCVRIFYPIKNSASTNMTLNGISQSNQFPVMKQARRLHFKSTPRCGAPVFTWFSGTYKSDLHQARRTIMTGIKSEFKKIPAFPPKLPILDPESVPQIPDVLFREWLEAAIETGARQTNAFTLVTVRPDGTPIGRTLILKNVVDLSSGESSSAEGSTAPLFGYDFSTHASSRKGLELAQNPRASLVFFWSDFGRQVRITGTVEKASEEISQEDWKGRPSYKGVPNPDWQVYRLVPDEFEFMQAREDRNHTRIEYNQGNGGKPAKSANWSHRIVDTPAG